MVKGSEHWMSVNERPEARIVRAHGSRLVDETGREILDFVQGWAVNCLGHSPEVVRRAIAEQAESVINVGPALFGATQLDLVSELARVTGLDRVFLANSGAEANDAAIKLARKWGQKYRGGAYEVLTTVDGFHGRTLATTCATGKAGWDTAFPPKVEGFPKVPFGDLEAMRAAIHPGTVAVLVEPVQGEAGVVVPPPDYLIGLRRLCDDAGILLIVDEIQTGLFRTGPSFAFRAAGIRPDIATLGKGLGGGLPVAALIATESAACFDLGDHGSTFGGNALVASAALAVVRELHAPAFEARRAHSSTRLASTLGGLARDHGATLRGSGHLFALVLDRPDASRIQKRAFENGLLLNAPRPGILRFMPALDVDDVAIAEMEGLLDRTIAEVRAEVTSRAS